MEYKMNKEDIRECGKGELFLIVSNTEKYYQLRNDIKLFKVLTSNFKYTLEQIKYLIFCIDEL